MFETRVIADLFQYRYFATQTALNLYDMLARIMVTVRIWPITCAATANRLMPKHRQTRRSYEKHIKSNHLIAGRLYDEFFLGITTKRRY